MASSRKRKRKGRSTVLKYVIGLSPFIVTIAILIVIAISGSSPSENPETTTPSSTIEATASNIKVLTASVFCSGFEEDYLYGECRVSLYLRNELNKSVLIYGVEFPQAFISVPMNTTLEPNETRLLQEVFELRDKTPLSYLTYGILVTSEGRVPISFKIAF
ncbi:MAG: hypothetical protein ABWW65_01675 [Thermoprotei archaeon]